MLEPGANALQSLGNAGDVLALLTPPPSKSADLHVYLDKRGVPNSSSTVDQRKEMANLWHRLATARVHDLLQKATNADTKSTGAVDKKERKAHEPPPNVVQGGDSTLSRDKVAMFNQLTRVFKGGVFQDWLAQVDDTVANLGVDIVPTLYLQLVRSRVSDAIVEEALFEVPLADTIEQLLFDYEGDLDEAVQERWRTLLQKPGETVAVFARRFRYMRRQMEQRGFTYTARAVRTAFLARIRASLARGVKAMIPRSVDFAEILRAAKYIESDERREQATQARKAASMVAAPAQGQGRAMRGGRRRPDCKDGTACEALRAGRCEQWHPACKDKDCPGSATCGRWHRPKSRPKRLHVAAVITAASARELVIRTLRSEDGTTYRVGRDSGCNKPFITAAMARRLRLRLRPKTFKVSRFGGTTWCRSVTDLEVDDLKVEAGVMPVLLPGVDVDVLLPYPDFDQLFPSEAAAAAAAAAPAAAEPATTGDVPTADSTETAAAEPVTDDTSLESTRAELRTELEELRQETSVGLSKMDPLTLQLTDPDVVVRVRPRTYRPDIAREVDAWLAKAIRQGVIEADHEPGGFETPLVIVRKKNGAIRPTQDCSRINPYLVMPDVPMPRMWDVLPTLGDARSLLFSEVDIAKAFHQVALSPGSRRITAFKWRAHRYRWTAAVMGAAPVPQEFQLRMERHVLEHADIQAAMEATASVVFVFVDNVLIATRAGRGQVQRHAGMLRALFERLRQLNLQPNAEDSTLAVRELDFLVFRLGDGVQLSPGIVAKLRGARPPKTKAELGSFLGLANLLRAFQPTLAETLEPLQAAFRKKRLEWTAECRRAFEHVTKELALAPTLTRWPCREDSPVLHVYTDASDVAIALVVTNAQSAPLVYWSRLLTATQRRWTPQDRELYAVFVALTQYRNLLMPATLHLFVDNKNVVANKARVRGSDSDRVARWKEAIQAFQVAGWHFVGTRNNPADYFSRAGGAECKEHAPADDGCTENDDAVYVAAINVADEKEGGGGVNGDEGQAVGGVDGDPDPALVAMPFELEEIVAAQEQDLELRHNSNPRHRVIGRLHVEYKDDDSTLRVLLPTGLLPRALEWAHAGHAGLDRMLRRLRVFSRPRLARLVKAFLKDCVDCMRVNAYPAHARPAWRALNNEAGVDAWHIDYTDGDLLVLVDRRSAFVMATRVEAATQEESIRVLTMYVERYGAPKQVISDNGSHFGDAFARTVRGFGASHHAILPGNSQANGKAEVANRVLKRMMNKGMSLSQAVAAHNNLPTAVGLVPAEVFLHRRAPLGWFDALASDTQAEVDTMLSEARAKYEKMESPGRERYPEIVVNQIVYSRESKAIGADVYKGPFVVLSTEHDEHIIARDLRTGHQAKLHRARIKPGNVQPEDIGPAGQGCGDAAVDEQQQWVVDKIVGHRKHRVDGVDRIQYKVRWHGFGAQDDSYVFPEDVSEVSVWEYVNELRRRASN